FPKALGADGNALRAGLFPKEWGEPFELQGGERKTHAVWLSFVRGEENASQKAFDNVRWAHEPPSVRCSREDMASTGAVPWLGVREANENASEPASSYLHEAIAGEGNLIAKRERVDEYGWRNFGDVWGDHEQAYYDGPT